MKNRQGWKIEGEKKGCIRERKGWKLEEGGRDGRRRGGEKEMEGLVGGGVKKV